MNEKHAQRPHGNHDEKLHEQDRNRQTKRRNQKQTQPTGGVYLPANRLETESMIMRHRFPHIHIAIPSETVWIDELIPMRQGLVK
ncbi:hypothetical protein [Paramagnetospirillum kuznetsovii]|uniref:hypothetical protein n=1 Tax=Paramagnetospirillum kuznetsovii TaxID=2053833 RepID=UPI0011BE90CA|nr:hypothetical protein [Paramagnetospirillum kuznetsovii]